MNVTTLIDKFRADTELFEDGEVRDIMVYVYIILLCALVVIKRLTELYAVMLPLRCKVYEITKSSDKNSLKSR
jgi:hypothetical protein